MGDLVGEAQLLTGSGAVTASDDGHGVGIGKGLGHGDGALGQGGILKHAHGAVPHHGLGSLGGSGELGLGLGADVQAHLAGGDGSGVHHLGGDLGINGVGEGIGNHGVHRQQQLNALGRGLGHHVLAVVQLLVVHQGGAHAAALSGQEGEGHAAADDQGVYLLQKVIDDVQLVGNLGAAQNGDEGTLGIGQGLAHDGDFLLHQVAADGGQIVRHTGGGGVGTVGGTEGIVHEHIRQGSQLLGQLRIVLGLALDEPGVLQQHDLARLQGGGLGLSIRACYVGSHDDLLAQQLGKPGSDHLQAQLFLPLALGLAHVGAEDDLGLVLHQILDGGQRGDDPLVGSDLAVLGGDVEVAAAQNALAGNVNILNRLLVVVHDNTSNLPRLLSHFSVVEQVWEGKLTKGLIDRNGHGVAQIQAPGLAAHGNPDSLVIMLCQKGLGKSSGLLAEKQVAAVGIGGLRVAPGSFGGQAPHLTHLVPGEEILQIGVVQHLHHMPVVQSRPAHGPLGDVKSQRTDQVQAASRGGTGAGNVAAILRNLRLHQDNIQQSHHLERPWKGSFGPKPFGFYCMP